MAIRVLLADDHSLVRQGFRRILEDESDVEVVGEAGGGAEAIELDRKLDPDVVVLDMSMPEINGLHAAIEILRHRPERRILILSMYDGAQYVRNALAAGVRGYILKNALETDLLRAVRTVANGGQFLSPELVAAIASPPGEDADADERFSQLSAREIQVLRLIALGRSNKEIAELLGVSANTVAVHRTNLMATTRCSQGRRARLDCREKGPGESPVNRPHAAGADRGRPRKRLLLIARTPAAMSGLGFELVDATTAAGMKFEHFTGASGRKYLPETLGSGVAVFDADGDGRQDVLLLSGTSLDSRTQPRGAALRLFRNTGVGNFEDVTVKSGLNVAMYAMGAAAADYDNDGHQDLVVTGVGQSRLFKNAGDGRFADVTERAGLGGRSAFSTSALWVDYDRDGLVDLLIGNYVRWTPETDVFCSADGKTKSYCTPEAYAGTTSWLYRNTGKGTFEDVTAVAGLFDPTSKALGVTTLDYDVDGWPDLFVANDTQPNKLYRNKGNRTFQEVGGAGRPRVQRGRTRPRRHGH